MACAGRGIRLPEAPASAGPIDLAPPVPVDGGAHRLRRAGRGLRTTLLVIAGIVSFNLAFPILVANQRPTVLTQSGTISAAAAATRLPEPGSVATWDLVDVDLFVRSCTESEPASVCHCQALALQPFYSGEQALAYADEQASRGRRAVLPTRYKDVLVRCSQSY